MKINKVTLTNAQKIPARNNNLKQGKKQQVIKNTLLAAGFMSAGALIGILIANKNISKKAAGLLGAGTFSKKVSETDDSNDTESLNQNAAQEPLPKIVSLNSNINTTTRVLPSGIIETKQKESDLMGDLETSTFSEPINGVKKIDIWRDGGKISQIDAYDESNELIKSVEIQRRYYDIDKPSHITIYEGDNQKDIHYDLTRDHKHIKGLIICDDDCSEEYIKIPVKFSERFARTMNKFRVII